MPTSFAVQVLSDQSCLVDTALDSLHGWRGRFELNWRHQRASKDIEIRIVLELKLLTDEELRQIARRPGTNAKPAAASGEPAVKKRKQQGEAKDISSFFKV